MTVGAKQRTITHTVAILLLGLIFSFINMGEALASCGSCGAEDHPHPRGSSSGSGLSREEQFERQRRADAARRESESKLEGQTSDSLPTSTPTTTPSEQSSGDLSGQIKRLGDMIRGSEEAAASEAASTSTTPTTSAPAAEATTMPSPVVTPGLPGDVVTSEPGSVPTTSATPSTSTTPTTSAPATETTTMPPPVLPEGTIISEPGTLPTTSEGSTAITTPTTSEASSDATTSAPAGETTTMPPPVLPEDTIISEPGTPPTTSEGATAATTPADASVGDTEMTTGESVESTTAETPTTPVDSVTAEEPETSSATTTSVTTPPAAPVVDKPDETSTADLGPKSYPPGVTSDTITGPNGEEIEIWRVQNADGTYDVGTTEELKKLWDEQMRAGQSDLDWSWWKNKPAEWVAWGVGLAGSIYVGIAYGPIAAAGSAFASGTTEEVSKRQMFEGYAEETDKDAIVFKGGVLGPLAAGGTDAVISLAVDGVLAGGKLAKSAAQKASKARKAIQKKAETAAKQATATYVAAKEAAEEGFATRGAEIAAKRTRLETIARELPDMNMQQRIAVAAELGVKNEGRRSLRTAVSVGLDSLEDTAEKALQTYTGQLNEASGRLMRSTSAATAESFEKFSKATAEYARDMARSAGADLSKEAVGTLKD